MNKYRKYIQDRRLFVGSGVEDIIDTKLHTSLDSTGQYSVDYTNADQRVYKVVYNSDESANDTKLSKKIFSKISNIRHDNTIGYYLDLYVGFVDEGGYRAKGSSGGFTTWVAAKLMEKGEIDGLIHVKKSQQDGILFEYAISRDVNGIQSGSKSRYYPVELSKVLKEVKAQPGRYAIVAIPEILSEVRLLAEQDKIIKDRIVYYLGLIAGHQKTTKYAEAIAWEYGIEPGNLIDIDFRVKRKVGSANQYDMRVTGLVDGKEKTYIIPSKEPFVTDWAHGFFKARFSDFTENAFNELADITFGDAWLEEYIDDPAGNNILIVRNKKLASIIKTGVKNKEVKLDIVDASIIIRSQKGLVHHTRDELPYRLSKEYRQVGWAPKKSIAPNSNLDQHRQRVQDIRQKIAEKSLTAYRAAVKKKNFNYFKQKMQPLVDEYNNLYGQKEVPKKHVRQHADGAILTLSGYFNYGNIVQRYALYKYLKNHGYNFVSYVNPNKPDYSWGVYRLPFSVRIKAPLRYVKRFIRRQKPYRYTPKISKIYPITLGEEHIIRFVNDNIAIKEFDPRDRYKNYIVGSDQVWRDWSRNKYRYGYFFLSFLKSYRTNRIAYAASFGKDAMEEVIDEESIEYIKPYIEQFDAVSVREKSGIDVIRNAWGINNVTTVVDPVLLLDGEHYSGLIDSFAKDKEIKPIFAYTVKENRRIGRFLQKTREHLGQEMTKIQVHTDERGVNLPPVELWLKGFRDAELVVTNSFHGMMFAVLNNTDFIVIGRKDGGLSRITDFLEDYGIEGRFVDEDEIDMYSFDSLKPIDWKVINEKVAKNRARSGKWLLAAVSKGGSS